MPGADEPCAKLQVEVLFVRAITLEGILGCGMGEPLVDGEGEESTADTRFEEGWVESGGRTDPPSGTELEGGIEVGV